MRLRSTLATAFLAGLVSFAVTFGVHAYRSPVTATSDDPFDVLDLTAEQKAEIHRIAMAHHPRLLERQAAVDTERRKLAGLLASPGVLDTEAVKRTLAEVSRLESELDTEVANNLIELRPHLTEAQQRTLFQHIELRHPRNNRPLPGDKP
jgi:Spy/CpxP family protein refolding chaperone